jgi:hypothetical protein
MNGIQYSLIIGGAGEVPSADQRAGRIPSKSIRQVSLPIVAFKF